MMYAKISLAAAVVAGSALITQTSFATPVVSPASQAQILAAAEQSAGIEQVSQRYTKRRVYSESDGRFYTGPYWAGRSYVRQYHSYGYRYPFRHAYAYPSTPYGYANPFPYYYGPGPMFEFGFVFH